MPLPAFNDHNVLPPGDYQLTFRELKESVLVHGPGTPELEHWDVEWRLFLVERAEVLVQQLWDVGIEEVYLDGSFVEAKSHPNDIDGYFISAMSMSSRRENSNAS